MEIKRMERGRKRALERIHKALQACAGISAWAAGAGGHRSQREGGADACRGRWCLSTEELSSKAGPGPLHGVEARAVSPQGSGGGGGWEAGTRLPVETPSDRSQASAPELLERKRGQVHVSRKTATAAAAAAARCPLPRGRAPSLSEQLHAQGWSLRRPWRAGAESAHPALSTCGGSPLRGGLSRAQVTEGRAASWASAQWTPAASSQVCRPAVSQALPVGSRGRH